MKVPLGRGGAEASTTSGVANPVIIVILVLVLGATIYLWRQRYIHRRTAYAVMATMVIAIVAAALLMYLNPV